MELRPLNGADLQRDIHGGKAVGLQRAAAAGSRVPEGFVLALPSGMAAPSAADLRLEEGPALQALRAMLPGGVVVRSSASVEDSVGQSYAGVFESVAGIVTEPDLIEAIRKCWASASSSGARSALVRAGDGDGIGMAVIAQAQIECDVAGVAFSVDPVTGEDRVVIEANWGQCGSIVDGRVEPDRYDIDRQGNVSHCLGTKGVYDALAGCKPITLHTPPDLQATRCLNDRAALDIAEAVRALADAFDAPVDVEWGMDGPALFVLQCRHVTALSDARVPSREGEDVHG